jgi:hypothetical protein
MPFGVSIDLITSMVNLEVLFCPPGTPGPPVHPLVISTKLTSRLSLAPCCAGQPSFGHIQAAPRRALLLLDSIRRRPSQAEITDLPGRAHSNWHKKRSRHEVRGMHSHDEGRRRLARPDLLANEVTGGDLIGVSLDSLDSTDRQR